MLIAITIITIYPAYSQEIPDSELEQREKVASSKVSDANSLDRSYGYYQKVRGEFYYSDNGVQTRSASFFQNSISWINNWSGILAVINLDNVTLNQLVNKIEIKMEEQSKLLLQLDNEAHSISQQGQRALEILKKGTTIKEGQLPEYSEYVSLALNQAKVLEDAIVSISGKAQSKIEDLKYINNVSHEAVLGKLKVELIRSGKYPVEESLARFNDLVTVEQVSSPFRDSIFEKVNKLNGYTLDFAYFQAKDTWEAAKAQCQLAQDALEPYTSSFATAAKNQINSLCDTADQHWDSLNNMGLSIADMAYEYAFLVGAELDANCKSNAPKAVCEKYAVIQSIGYDKLLEMSDDRLEFYEKEWSQLASTL